MCLLFFVLFGASSILNQQEAVVGESARFVIRVGIPVTQTEHSIEQFLSNCIKLVSYKHRICYIEMPYNDCMPLLLSTISLNGLFVVKVSDRYSKYLLYIRLAAIGCLNQNTYFYTISSQLQNFILRITLEWVLKLSMINVFSLQLVLNYRIKLYYWPIVFSIFLLYFKLIKIICY